MFELPEGWSVAFEHRMPAACAERALVLISLEIPQQTLQFDGLSYLLVPSEVLERARYELWQYDKENQPAVIKSPRITPGKHDGLPGILVYIGLIGLFAWLAGEAAFNRDWLAAGRMDGTRFRDGEIWRSFTALTLHVDLRHLLGNMGFGGVFGYFAGRLLGSGAGWLAIVTAAAAATSINALLGGIGWTEINMLHFLDWYTSQL